MSTSLASPPAPDSSRDSNASVSSRLPTRSPFKSVRPRSVQFPGTTSPMSRSPTSRSPTSRSPTSRSPTSRSPRREQIPLQGAESSADEITPIVGRERGASKAYDSTVQAELNKQSASKSSESNKGKKGSKPSRQSEEQTDAGGWWKDFVDRYGSVELDNKGSVARDHLALERTFLAWLRTSLAFASIGIAVTQLFRLNTAISERDGLTPGQSTATHRLRQLGKPLGATFLGIAILVLLTGSRRYFESQHWIIRGKFPASRGSIFLITFLSAVLIVTSMVLVLTFSPTILEKH